MTKNALNELDCSILWSSVYLEGINQYLRFLQGDSHQGKLGSETTTYVSTSNQITGFFDHQFLCEKASDILVFLQLVIKQR